MKKVNFKKLGKQFIGLICGAVLFGGIMLNTQEMEGQQEPVVNELQECDTCQRNRRQANVTCIRANAQNGGTWSIWMGDRMKCKSDQSSDCPGETSCSQS